MSETGDTNSESRQSAKLRSLAWLPIPLLLAAIIAGRVAGLRETYEFDSLRLVLSIIFYTLVSLGTIFLIGRSFLASGAPGLLLLECGVVFWSLAGTVGDAVSHGNANIDVTIFNIGILLSGLCQLAGAILALRPQRSLSAKPLWLAAACTFTLCVLGLITWATLTGRLPVFFIPRQGGTPICYWVLISAIATFVLSAGLLRAGQPAALPSFTAWYTLALLLLAVGLFGIMIQLSLGSAVNWLARTAQWLGGLYLLIAAIASVRATGVWLITLDAAGWDRRLALWDDRLRDRLRYSMPTLCAGIFVMLIGMLSLLGWIFDIEMFKQFLHHGISIKANTAIALLLAGLSLCLFILDNQHRWVRRLGQVCAALVFIVGVLSLSEHSVGWDLGIDQIFFQEPPGPPGSLSPGRPGPPASLCFILGGLAILLLHERSKKNHLLLQILAVGIGLIAAPGLIGYAYGAEYLYGVAQYTAIAFHTALALAFLAAGILFAYPKEGIASLVYDKGIGGSIARRLLPPAILVPLVLGWFRLRGEEQGYFIAAFGTAIMMLIMIFLLSSLVLRTAAIARHSERQQQLTEGALLMANQELEQRVAERTDELRAAFRYARSLLEASLDPLVTISPEGKITDVNQATELATDITRKELIGNDFSSYFTEPEKASDGYRKVFSEGLVRDYPLTIRHASGSTMDVLYNATIYKNEAGEVQGVFAAARDITQKKAAEAELEQYRLHLEELVSQRTEELSRSNRDLEQFAYAASHDLQEPLRMIAGYLQLLSERYKGQLDEKADKYIDYSVDGASRMSILIRDLLEYSRVNTRGEELHKVDSKKALESALRNLGTAIEESGAAVTFDSLPVIRADKTQLAQLFQNLIGNSIKFRSPRRPPQIHVSVRKDGEHWHFCVQDNGIGFEQEYEDKIFMIFQRLHGRGQYQGTGIGLAICKRIIERHGGKIWAASEPDKGTNFFFTIPI